jgi:hypothetical protein
VVLLRGFFADILFPNARLRWGAGALVCPMKKNGHPRKVVKLAPERPEARDEGPRLIPLDERRSSDQFGRRALELADIALGLREPAARKTPKKKN